MDFPKLQELMTRMGARPSAWRLRPYETKERQREREELRKELQQGKEIRNLEEVESRGELLTHKGEQIVLYIKDTRQEKFILLHYPEEAKRFHVAECQTIRGMRWKGRFERYVVTTRQDGKFLVEAADSDDEFEAPLRVCKNCLTHLDWKGYARSRSDKVWKEFSLRDFFAEFTTFFSQRPRYTDLTAPRGGYGKDWPRLAGAMKRKRGWRCDECGVNLSKHRNLLHGHHKNGVTSNNRQENIAVLCLLCHSEQPYHGRVKPTEAERKLIKSLRRETKNASPLPQPHS